MDRRDGLIHITETGANMVDIGRLRPDLNGSKTRLEIVDGSGIREFVAGRRGATDYMIIGRQAGVGRQFSIARLTAVGTVVRVLIIENGGNPFGGESWGSLYSPSQGLSDKSRVRTGQEARPESVPATVRPRGTPMMPVQSVVSDAPQW